MTSPSWPVLRLVELRCLDEQHVAARAGHGQTRRDARYARAACHLEEELLPAEIAPDVTFVDANQGTGFARGDSGRHLAQDVAELTLQIADARLARVVGDDPAERRLRDLDLARAKTVEGDLAPQQVIPGNGELVIFGVAIEANHLRGRATPREWFPRHWPYI